MSAKISNDGMDYFMTLLADVRKEISQLRDTEQELFARVLGDDGDELPPAPEPKPEGPKVERVALITVFNDRGQLLLGTRLDNGKFTLAGGHLEGDETPEDGARRELYEEAGLTAQTLSPLTTYTLPSGMVLHCFSAFAVGTPHGENDPDKECEVWEWVDVSEGLDRKYAENLHGPSDIKYNLLLQLFNIQEKTAKSMADSEPTMPKAPKTPKIKTPAPPKEPHLAVVHNLSQDNLKHAHALGGLAAPSLAVIHKDHPFDSFGDVTLVAHPSMVDPKDTPVADADIYTPRHPRPEYKINPKEAKAFSSFIQPHVKATSPRSYLDLDDSLKKDGAQGLLNDSQIHAGLAHAYAAEKGFDNSPVTKEKGSSRFPFRGEPALKDFVAQHGPGFHHDIDDENHKALSVAAKQAIDQYAAKYNKVKPGMGDELKTDAIEDHFDPDTGNFEFSKTDRLLRDVADHGQTEVDHHPTRAKLLQTIKDNGHEDEFNKWAEAKVKPLEGERYIPKWTSSGNVRKIPYNLENVLKEVTSTLRGGEGFNYGLGTARSFGAKRFRSLDGVKDESHRLIPGEEFDKLKEKQSDDFVALVTDLDQHHPHPGYGGMDRVSEALGDSFKQGKSLANELAAHGYKNIPTDKLKKLQEFANRLRTMPTQYFEAKPQRAVGLNEFHAAAVPHDASEETLKILDHHGIKHLERYTRGNREERAAAVARAATAKKLLLSESDSGFEELVKAADDLEKAEPKKPEYSYHVTYNGRLPKIAENGLQPNAARSIGAPAMDGHSAGRLFFAEQAGAQFWHARARDHAEHNHDNPVAAGAVPVVLRVPKKAIKRPSEDGPGTQDSLATAFHVKHGVEPKHIEAWHGTGWGPVSDHHLMNLAGAANPEGQLSHSHESSLFPKFEQPKPAVDHAKMAWQTAVSTKGSRIRTKHWGDGVIEHPLAQGQSEGAIHVHLDNGSSMSMNAVHATPHPDTFKSEAIQKSLPKTETCSECSKQATTRVLHAEGMAYQPACEDHIDTLKAKFGNDFSGCRRIEKSEESDLTKGVADIKPQGILPGNDVPTHDYTHLLPAKHQAEGYMLGVSSNERGMMSQFKDPDGYTVGHVKGLFTKPDKYEPAHEAVDQSAQGIEPHSNLNDEHQGQGIGTAMYEATYAHAKNVHGLTHVLGGVHSAQAHALHQRLAAKHGFEYHGGRQIEPSFPGRKMPFPHDSYAYALKEEKPAVEPDIFEDPVFGTASDLTKNELAKSEHDDEIMRLLKHPNSIERGMALKLAGVGPQHLDAAAVDQDANVQAMAMKHPLFDDERIQRLMDNERVGPKVAFLNLLPDRVTPEHLGAALEQHAHDEDLQRVISRHPRLNEALHRSLYQDHRISNISRLALLTHPEAHPETLAEALRTGMRFGGDGAAVDCAKAAIPHPKMPQQALDDLIGHACNSNPGSTTDLASVALRTRPQDNRSVSRILAVSQVRPQAQCLLTALCENLSLYPEHLDWVLGSHQWKAAAANPNLTTVQVDTIVDRCLAAGDKETLSRVMDARNFGSQHLQKLLAPKMEPAEGLHKAEYPDSLGQTETVSDGVHFKTGKPVAFNYFRNNASGAAKPGAQDTFQQRLEPHGRFVSHVNNPHLTGPQYESGQMQFKNPLVVHFNNGPSPHAYDNNSWKARLNQTFKKKGRALSQHIVGLGHDGVVTVDHKGNSSEIVDLRPHVFKAEGLHKSEEKTLSEGDLSAAQDMMGHDPIQTPSFKAASFLAGGTEPSVEQLRQSLYQHDGDTDAAALSAHGLEISEGTRKALAAVSSMAAPKQSEHKRHTATNVEAVQPEGQDIAEAIKRAYADKFVLQVQLAGKHSKGSLIARDEAGKKSYLIKTGSGNQSPAAGANQDASSQSAREAAWHHIAEIVNLGSWYPRTELIRIDGKEVAVMELLPWSFKGLDKKERQEPGFARRVLHPLLADGTLHKWAVLDLVFGNSDSHGQNIMCDDEGNVRLIDHGSAFAGSEFDPAHDENTFTPYYLRAWAPPTDFNKLPAEEKLRLLPRTAEAAANELKEWILGLSEASLSNMMGKYSIDPAPSLARLAKLKAAVANEPADLAVNRLWTVI